eukprot:12888970-Prorocentrum_lima.AAC.1
MTELSNGNSIPNPSIKEFIDQVGAIADAQHPSRLKLMGSQHANQRGLKGAQQTEQLEQMVSVYRMQT